MADIDINSIGRPLILWCADHEIHFVEGNESHAECESFLNCHTMAGSCGGPRPTPCVYRGLEHMISTDHLLAT